MYSIGNHQVHAVAVIRENLMVEMEINIEASLERTLPLAPVTRRLCSWLSALSTPRRRRAEKQNHPLPCLDVSAKWRKVASSRRRVNQPSHYPN